MVRIFRHHNCISGVKGHARIQYICRFCDHIMNFLRAHNRACHLRAHYWDYYRDILSPSHINSQEDRAPVGEIYEFPTFKWVEMICTTRGVGWGGEVGLGWWGCGFKNSNELLNARALHFSTLYGMIIFQCRGEIFQRKPLKIHTNILPIYWKICFLYKIKILRALRFKSS